MSIARGKIDLAVDRLASDYPLHAGILAQWRIEAEPSVGTMGVGFRDDRLRLVYSPDFVESITLDELTGVLHHEANHVLFEHVLHVPKPDEDRSARTIAEELTVNEWVPEPLPGTPVTLTDYPRLPANEDTETRYGKLRGMASPDSAPRGALSGASDSDQDSDSDTKDQAGKRTKPGTSVQATGAQPNAAGEPQKPGISVAQTSNGVPTVDSHDTWAEVAESGREAKRAAKMDIALAWGNMTGEQRDALGAPFEEIAEAASIEVGIDLGLVAGSVSGSDVSALDGGTAHVPWQVILRRYVGKIMRLRPVFGRPPRRFPDMVGIIPGKGRFAAKPHVMAVIDTSGSMSGPVLSDISAELAKMAASYEVTVVECDVVIHAVYPYRPIISVRGRGGTDFRPPLEMAFIRKHQADLVVYFTDGYGPAPDKAPRIPVIWGVIDGGRKPAKWGQEIRIDGRQIGP
ncbi:MAG: hypothetical protein HN341_00855 [Verrucomicrobia bacterium]|jgi:hypothetical protein|nr:hypothetical protein [Verrucomicrobiota bacterium]